MTVKVCTQFIRWLMVLFNIIFLFCGISFTSFGIWSLLSTRFLAQFIGPDLVKPIALFLVLTGTVVTLLAFCGCTGAALENKCVLIIFFIVLSILFLLFLICGVLAATFLSEVHGWTADYLTEKIEKEYGKTDKVEWTEFVDLIQETYGCCAVNTNKADVFLRSPWYKREGILASARVPVSCCKMKSGSVENAPACQSEAAPYKDNVFLNNDGCFSKMIDQMHRNMSIVLAVVFGVLLVMLLGMMFSAILTSQHRSYVYRSLNYVDI